MSDSEEDLPLMTRFKKTTTSFGLCQYVDSEEDIPLTKRFKKDSVPDHLKRVEGEGEVLNGNAWEERAQQFRDRARKIFEVEVDAVLKHPNVTEAQKESLLNFSFCFDKGTTRRGVCKYPRVPGGKGFICLSAKMVDNGTPSEKIQKVIRHEISHACNRGCKHNHIWKSFDVMIGGDGKRCCDDKEVRDIIGHKVEVYCSLAGPVQGTGHYFVKKQKAPTLKKLTTRICRKCKQEDGVVSKLAFRRV